MDTEDVLEILRGRDQIGLDTPLTHPHEHVEITLPVTLPASSQPKDTGVRSPMTSGQLEDLIAPVERAPHGTYGTEPMRAANPLH